MLVAVIYLVFISLGLPANNYSGAVMNFLHCFYGVGAMISPNIMAMALRKTRWNEGYRWTA